MSSSRFQPRTHLPLVLLALACVLWLAARLAAIRTVAFNWDELVLFDRAARSLADGVLRGVIQIHDLWRTELF